MVSKGRTKTFKQYNKKMKRQQMILNANKKVGIPECDMGLGTCDIKCIRVNYPHPGKYLSKV